MARKWQSATSTAEKWEVIRDGLKDVGESVLGWETKIQQKSGRSSEMG